MLNLKIKSQNLLLPLLFFFSSPAFAQETKELEQAFAPYLPQKIRAELIGQLQKIDWSTEGMAKIFALEFTSEESKTNEADRIHNKVRRLESPRFDLWFMEQRKAADTAKGAAFNKLLIAVDKNETGGPRAYYLEFGTSEISKGRIPLPQPYTAACYSCHASGPRAIRSEKIAGHPFPDDSGKKIIEEWNKEIAALKTVNTHFPSARPDVPVPPIHRTEPAMMEEFRHRSCSECHNSESGLRAPLFRQHRYSILALLEKGHMPMDAPRLSGAEIACVEAWLKGPAALSKRKECNSYGELLLGKSARKAKKLKTLVPRKTSDAKAFSLGFKPARSEV